MAPDHPRIRTFHGRHGRTTPRMAHVLGTIGPRRSLAARPPGDRPLVVEVGCGHGEAAIGFARAHLGTDLVAVDVHTPGVAHLLEQADREGLDNLYVERTDALDLLDHRVGPGSLHGLHLFFPDPWPKARHHKRRFVRPDVLDLVADRLRPGGVVLVASDVDDYVAAAMAHLDAHPAFTGGVAPRPGWRPVTRYESAAGAEGRTVVDLRYRRR